MRIEELPIAGTALVETTPLSDERGSFARVFCSRDLQALLGDRPIVQANISRTRHPHTVRGMHFQHPPNAEIKLIRCLRGSVFDVMVDIRSTSPTFLRWHAHPLEADSLQMIVVPEGVAHGFQTLTSDVELLYLHTASYSPDSEGGLHPEDPALAIQWPHPIGKMSDRDRRYPFVPRTFRGVDV